MQRFRGIACELEESTTADAWTNLIYLLLFMQLGARMLWPVYRNNNGSSKTDVRKQTHKPDKRKSPTGPSPVPICPRSVVPKEVVSRGDAPSQGRVWHSLCLHGLGRAPELSHGVRPFLPSIPLDRLPPQSHSPPFSTSASSPVSPLEPLWYSSWGC